jgi:hypothetical protein
MKNTHNTVYPEHNFLIHSYHYYLLNSSEKWCLSVADLRRGGQPAHAPKMVSSWGKRNKQYKKPHFGTFSEGWKQCLWFIATFEGKTYISVQKWVNFASVYQFYPIYNERNIVKMTSWETCFKAYKISKIQELPGSLPPGPPPGLCPGPTGSLKAAPQTPCLK